MSESFYCKIANLYGEVCLKKVRSFETLRIKRNKLESGLVFVQKCRDNGVLPKFLRVKPIKCFRDYEKFFNGVNNNVVKRVIKDYYRNISITTTELLSLHLELSRTLGKDFWDTLDSMSYNRAQCKQCNVNKTHDKKFQRLTKNSYQSHTDICELSNDRQSVVNLSSKELSDTEKSVLSKGMNFAPTPRKIPVDTIITGIEETIARNSIPSHEAECLRQEVALTLRHAKVPKPNVSRREMSALQCLRKNEDILVLPADKGNATVVVDTVQYQLKMTELLSDGGTYKRVTYDPTSRTTAKLKTLLRELSDDLHARLRPLNPTAPRIYGLPKIHKPSWPLRPITCVINSPTYKTARHMADMLLPLTGNTTSFVRDSLHFVHLLEEVVLAEDELMVSFDVTSLFTNIPIADTIKIITNLFQTALIPIEYIKIIEYVLTSGYFKWQGEFYKQTEGVAMGSPIAPVIANIFMEWFETTALKDTSYKPRFWWRYVDDVFAILRRDHVIPLLEELNNRHPKMAFTVEKETAGALPFLDVLVKRLPSGRLSHTVYRKKTHTDRYLNAKSHHHPAHLASLPRTLINRALRLCDQQHVDTELAHVKSVLEANGYSWKQSQRVAHTSAKKRLPAVERAASFLPYLKGVTDKIGHLLRRRYSIKTIFRPLSQVRHWLRSPKDNDPLASPGVYMIPCDCGECYVGETKRNVSTRLKEHISSMKNADSSSSAVADHALTSSTTHYIRFDKARILAREKYFIPRKIREAIEISRRPNFNRDRGWYLSPTWKTVLHGARSSIHSGEEDTISFACRADATSSGESSSEEDDVSQPITAPSQHSLQPPPPPPPTLTARAARAAARSAKREATSVGAPCS